MVLKILLELNTVQQYIHSYHFYFNINQMKVRFHDKSENQIGFHG